MPGGTGVTLGAPAAAVVAAALRVGDHHVVLGLAADQTLVNMEETHILVSCGAIWKNKGGDKCHLGSTAPSERQLWRIHPHQGEDLHGSTLCHTLRFLWCKKKDKRKMKLNDKETACLCVYNMTDGNHWSLCSACSTSSLKWRREFTTNQVNSVHCAQYGLTCKTSITIQDMCVHA